MAWCDLQSSGTDTQLSALLCLPETALCTSAASDQGKKKICGVLHLEVFVCNMLIALIIMVPGGTSVVGILPVFLLQTQSFQGCLHFPLQPWCTINWTQPSGLFLGGWEMLWFAVGFFFQSVMSIAKEMGYLKSWSIWFYFFLLNKLDIANLFLWLCFQLTSSGLL